MTLHEEDRYMQTGISKSRNVNIVTKLLQFVLLVLAPLRKVKQTDVLHFIKKGETSNLCEMMFKMSEVVRLQIKPRCLNTV